MINFHFLDGPYACNFWPLEIFVKKGFKGTKEGDPSKPYAGTSECVRYFKNKPEIDFRYYGWQTLDKRFDENIKDLKMGCTLLNTTMVGVDGCIDYMINYLN